MIRKPVLRDINGVCSKSSVHLLAKLGPSELTFKYKLCGQLSHHYSWLGLNSVSNGVKRKAAKT